MNFDTVRPVADAVLYEGYILYPYRANSAKNRQRWTFGGVYPEIYRQATDDAEPSALHCECLLQGDADTRLEVRLRCLQPADRQVIALEPPQAQWPVAGAATRPVRSLTVAGQQLQSWQEAVEHDLPLFRGRLGELAGAPWTLPFELAGTTADEPVTGDDGQVHALLQRRRQSLAGRARIELLAVTDTCWRLAIDVANVTEMDPACVATRDEASLYSFASTHLLLGNEGGAFLSLTDPPERLAAAAGECRNDGAWPVLVGESGSRDRLLCSPIILGDYPQVAPESPGDLFDGTEIDEILSLNILAMTDEEKRDMAATDARAAALLARTESLDADDFMRLHGVLRKPRTAPAPVRHNVHDVRLKVGDRVRLHPRAGGDVMDLVLDGKQAVIEAIEQDFEDRVHVAVALDDDPGRDWGLQRMPGHRFFFSPEEIEAIEPAYRAGADR